MSLIKTAIVTGGAGFIGSHTVDLLLSNEIKVRVIDNFSGGHEKNLYHHKNNSNLTIENKSILNVSKDEKIFKNVDYLFHFAGIGDIVPSIEEPFKYMETNVLGTLKVLEASRNSNVKSIVYAASSSCYGIAKTPTDESHLISIIYPYALSKYQGEQIALHWGNLYKMKVNSLRIFNAYGTRVRTTGAYGAVFGVFLKQKLENKPLTIVGDGTQKRDFLYVTDVAEAFFSLAKSDYNNQIFNLGANNPQSINYLANLIGGKLNYLPKRSGEPDITWANIDKIRKKLNWYPKVSFENGVQNMLDEIDNWKDAPLWDVNKINKATKTWFKYLS